MRKLTVLPLQTVLRVMQMLIAHGSDEELDAQMAFGEDEITVLKNVQTKTEGKTEKLKNKHPTGTLKWATWIHRKAWRLVGLRKTTSARTHHPEKRVGQVQRHLLRLASRKRCGYTVGRRGRGTGVLAGMWVIDWDLKGVHHCTFLPSVKYNYVSGCFLKSKV
ncbi:MAG: hypothetical protein QM642_04005 [Edaphocola sp.]